MDSDQNDVLNDSADIAEDEEPMTSVEALAALEEAWLNEELCPDLLEHRTELVECMQAQIKQMEQNISRLKKGDVLISVHKMEIDRVNYIIRSYLKCRLKKIEKYGAYFLNRDREKRNQESSMSPSEIEFSQCHVKSIDEHLKHLTLRHLPANLQTFDTSKTMPAPNLSTYVFLKMNRNIPGFSMIDDSIEGGEEIFDLVKDTQHIMPFKPVAHLIKSGEASLI